MGRGTNDLWPTAIPDGRQELDDPTIGRGLQCLRRTLTDDFLGGQVQGVEVDFGALWNAVGGAQRFSPPQRPGLYADNAAGAFDSLEFYEGALATASGASQTLTCSRVPRAHS